MRLVPVLGAWHIPTRKSLHFAAVRRQLFLRQRWRRWEHTKIERYHETNYLHNPGRLRINSNLPDLNRQSEPPVPDAPDSTPAGGNIRDAAIIPKTPLRVVFRKPGEYCVWAQVRAEQPSVDLEEFDKFHEKLVDIPVAVARPERVGRQ